MPLNIELQEPGPNDPESVELKISQTLSEVEAEAIAKGNPDVTIAILNRCQQVCSTILSAAIETIVEAHAEKHARESRTHADNENAARQQRSTGNFSNEAYASTFCIPRR